MGDSLSTVHGKIAGHAGVVAFFTTLSRIAGLVRDQVTLHVFGATATTDAFFVAFTIPNTLRRFVAEGALTISFIPVYSDVRRHEGEDEAKKFYASTLGLLLIVLTVLVILGIIFASSMVYAFASGFAQHPAQMAMATWLTQLMYPYIFFISLVALYMGVLNSHHHFAVPAASPILLNVAMVVCTLGFHSYFEEPILALALGVLIGGVLQLIVQFPVLYRYGLLIRPSFQFNTKPIRKLLHVLFPSVFGIAVYQINLLISRQLGSYLPAGQISYYYTADRLMQFALGIFAFSIATAALPAMSEQTSTGDIKGLVKTWGFSTRLTNFITVPAAFGLMAIGVPIVSVLYLHGQYNWHDVQVTAWATIAFAPGLIFVAMSRTTVQAFYAMKDMRTPVMVAIVCVIVNLICGIALLKYEVVGLAWSLTISSFVQTIMLIVWLRLKVGFLGARSLLISLIQQCIFSSLIAGIAWWICLSVDWSQSVNLYNVFVLFLAIIVAICLYVSVALLFKIEEAIMLKKMVIRKIYC